MNYGERLRWARERIGITQKQLEERSKVNQGTISKIERNAQTESAYDAILAHHLGVDAYWLSTGSGSPLKDESEVNERAADYKSNRSDYIAIPFKTIKARATVDGVEVHFLEDDEMPIFYRKDWVEAQKFRPAALVARKLSGSSMEPALYDGDTVLINTDAQMPRNGKVFLVLVDGILCCKRLRKKAGDEWWITSDNPAHSKTDQPLENTNQILGQVVEKMSSNI